MKDKGFFTSDHIEMCIQQLILDFSGLLLGVTWLALAAGYMDGDVKMHISSYILGSITIGVAMLARAKTVGEWAFEFMSEPLISK
jgi:hypothetical protein